MIAEPAALILGIFCLFISLVLLPFCRYHLSIAAHNVTTNEDVKAIYARVKNPFDRGSCGANMRVLCCSEVAPSQLSEYTTQISAEEFIYENLPAAIIESMNNAKAVIERGGGVRSGVEGCDSGSDSMHSINANLLAHNTLHKDYASISEATDGRDAATAVPSPLHFDHKKQNHRPPSTRLVGVVADEEGRCGCRVILYLVLLSLSSKLHLFFQKKTRLLLICIVCATCVFDTLEVKAYLSDTRKNAISAVISPANTTNNDSAV